MSQISNPGGFLKQPGRARPARRDGGAESRSLFKSSPQKAEGSPAPILTPADLVTLLPKVSLTL